MESTQQLGLNALTRTDAVRDENRSNSLMLTQIMISTTLQLIWACTSTKWYHQMPHWPFHPGGPAAQITMDSQVVQQEEVDRVVGERSRKGGEGRGQSKRG
jgi:hypothetical protein